MFVIAMIRLHRKYIKTMGAKQKPTRPVPNLCTMKSITTMPHDIPTITPAAQYFFVV